MIEELAPWFQNLHLPDGRRTAPDHPLGDYPAFKWEKLAPHLPGDLTGWRALDLGCNAGFYSFQLARRGADVVAADFDERYLRQARWAAGELELAEKIEFRKVNVYQLAQEREQFDLVMFLGVLYHLRHPLLALDILREKVRKLFVFQSLTMPGEGPAADPSAAPRDLAGVNQREMLLLENWPKMAFIEHEFAGDPTNWWIPNAPAIEAMLRSSGFKIEKDAGNEIYLCKPDPKKTSRASLQEVFG